MLRLEKGKIRTTALLVLLLVEVFLYALSAPTHVFELPKQRSKVNMSLKFCACS